MQEGPKTTHKQNFDFQSAYFLAGTKHTPDAAWTHIVAQTEAREEALKLHDVSRKRLMAKKLKAERILAREDDDILLLEAEADLKEAENALAMDELTYQGAVRELAFLCKIRDMLEPLRKYAHLPDAEAHEASQREEWLYELLERAQNSLYCHGTLSPDNLSAMRMHPDFNAVIAPALDQMFRGIASGKRPDLIAIRPGAQDMKDLLAKIEVLALAPPPLEHTNALPRPGDPARDHHS